ARQQELQPSLAGTRFDEDRGDRVDEEVTEEQHRDGDERRPTEDSHGSTISAHSSIQRSRFSSTSSGSSRLGLAGTTVCSTNSVGRSTVELAGNTNQVSGT